VLSEYDPLTSVLVKHARDAFVDAETLGSQWRTLGFASVPDLGRAVEESDRFVDMLRSTGADVHLLPRWSDTTLDSIYARDASIMVPGGVALCRMGKPQRQGEPAAQREAFERIGVPVVGQISPPGTLEGGDLIWLDPHTVVVGRGYRTNAAGVAQLRDLVGSAAEVVEVPLPHWRGQADVMHLMSLISPVDGNLAVVYSPLLPVPFREMLVGRGIRLVEVPDSEFDSMGTNVLALAPRRCVMLKGNPLTRAGLETAGCEVLEYEGKEISVKGAGGPTCLTRPLARGRPSPP
jgi:N-dimethylarginine dimethylaminohydrolase